MRKRAAVTEGDVYRRTKIRVRRRPSWVLRRWERRIVAQSRPTLLELAELAAVRRELRVRSVPRFGVGRRG